MSRAAPKADAGLGRVRSTKCCAAIAAALGILVSRCGGVGTALLIRAELNQIPPVTQLRMSGQTQGGIVFGPITRPERAVGPLPDAQTLRVLLPDSLAGQSVRVSVQGLSGQTVLASGHADAIVVRGDEVALTVRLAP